MKSLAAALSGVALALTIVCAHAQTADALAGMQAYNRGDMTDAYRLLRSAADAGDAEAEVNLGYMYARGQGGAAENQQEAFRLYGLSAAQGDGEGMNALAYKYLNGSGVAADPDRAVHWYCNAIAVGNLRAMNNLAGMLETGEHVTRDVAEAESLWLQAAALGYSNAMINLAQFYAGAGDAAKTQQWLLRAAQKGNPKAIQILQSHGYTGMLPPQFDETAMMIPWVKNITVQTKSCSLTT